MKKIRRTLLCGFTVLLIFASLITNTISVVAKEKDVSGNNADQSAKATEPVQSPDVYDITIRHEHERNRCYRMLWISCGGQWTNFTNEEGKHVYSCTNQFSKRIVNGHPLTDAHFNKPYFYGEMDLKTEFHDGSYVEDLICDVDVLGTIRIERHMDDGHLRLLASVTDDSRYIEKYKLEWAENDSQLFMNWSTNLFTDIRGTHELHASWYDPVTREWFYDTFEYTDFSLPLMVSLRSEGSELSTLSVPYGELPEHVEVPVRKGYDFCGYEKDGVYWIDKDGKPTAAFDAKMPESAISLDAVWSARKYTVCYGPDSNKDGVPDRTFDTEFDKAYSSVNVSGEIKTGYLFDGYKSDEENVFDKDGAPTGNGIWRWDPKKDSRGRVILSEAFSPKVYEIKCNGKSYKVTYDAPYEAVAPAAKKIGHVFKGYTVSGDLAYDQNGKAVSKTWKWDIENGLALGEEYEPKTFKIKCGDKTYSVTYGEKYGSVSACEVDKDSIFMGYKYGDESVFDENGKPVEAFWKWDGDEGGVIELKAEIKKKPEPTATPTPAPTTETATGTSDESVSKNLSKGKTNGPGNGSGMSDGQKSDSVSSGSVSSDSVSSDSVSSDAVSEDKAMKKKNKAVPSGGSGNDSSDAPSDTVLKKAGTQLTNNGEKTITDAKDEAVVSEVVKEDEGNESVPQSSAKTVQAASRNKERKNTGEKHFIMPPEVVKTAAAVGGVSAAAAGGVYVLQAGFIYLFAMADIINVSPAGKRKEIGKVTVGSKRGKLSVEVGRSLINKCDAGHIEILFSKPFVWAYRNRPLKVTVGGKAFMTALSDKVEARI